MIQLLMAIWLIPRNDVVHIHVADNTSFYRKTCFFVLSSLFGGKTILHLHAPYMGVLEKRSLRAIRNVCFQG